MFSAPPTGQGNLGSLQAKKVICQVSKRKARFSPMHPYKCASKNKNQVFLFLLLFRYYYQTFSFSFSAPPHPLCPLVLSCSFLSTLSFPPFISSSLLSSFLWLSPLPALLVKWATGEHQTSLNLTAEASSWVKENVRRGVKKKKKKERNRNISWWTG